MQSEDKIRLHHILDEANEACQYVEGLSFDEFKKDGKTVRAVIRGDRETQYLFKRESHKNNVGSLWSTL